MRRSLLILFALILLVPAAPARAVGIYGVAGVLAVETYQWCGPDALRVTLHILHAADGEARRFSLGVPPEEILQVGHTGMISRDGAILTFDPIDVGDAATVSIVGGSCQVTAPHLALYSPRWLPLIMR